MEIETGCGGAGSPCKQPVPQAWSGKRMPGAERPFEALPNRRKTFAGTTA